MHLAHTALATLAVFIVPLAVRLSLLDPARIDANALNYVDVVDRVVRSGGVSSRTWGPATATVNWCEEDHAVTWAVAEFWNVLSSVAIAMTGIWGLWAHGSSIDPASREAVLEKRFRWSFAWFVVVGLGSMAFHATLWRSMQLLDELPMLWTSTSFVYILRTMEDARGKGARRTEAFLLGLAIVAMTLAVVFLDRTSQNVFLLCYGSGVAYIVIRSVVLQRRIEPIREQRLVETALLFYFGAFLLWLLDRNFCATVRPFNFHALWHIGASIGTYSVLLSWLWLRYKLLGWRPVLRGSTYATRWIEISKLV